MSIGLYKNISIQKYIYLYIKNIHLNKDKQATEIKTNNANIYLFLFILFATTYRPLGELHARPFCMGCTTSLFIHHVFCFFYNRGEVELTLKKVAKSLRVSLDALPNTGQVRSHRYGGYTQRTSDLKKPTLQPTAYAYSIHRALTCPTSMTLNIFRDGPILGNYPLCQFQTSFCSLCVFFLLSFNTSLSRPSLLII